MTYQNMLKTEHGDSFEVEERADGLIGLSVAGELGSHYAMLTPLEVAQLGQALLIFYGTTREAKAAQPREEKPCS